MTELWDICLSDRALIRCLQEKLPGTAIKASEARKIQHISGEPQESLPLPLWGLG